MNGDDMLEIDMDSKYGILFVRLFGQLTNKTRKKLNEVKELLTSVGIKNVVFNIENLNKMDEKGFKTLVKCYKLCENNNGNTFFCFNQNKFDYDFKQFNLVSDELSAVNIINV